MEFSTLGKGSFVFFCWASGTATFSHRAPVKHAEFRQHNHNQTRLEWNFEVCEGWQLFLYNKLSETLYAELYPVPTCDVTTHSRSRSQAKSGMSQIFWNILFKYCYLTQKHRTTTCIENCPRKRTEVAFWRQVWLTLNYMVTEKGPMWHPDDTHFSMSPPPMRKDFFYV